LGGVAYEAHVSGFVAGFALAIVMLKTKIVVMSRDEKLLLELLGLDKKQILKEPKRDIAYWQQRWEKSDREKANLKKVLPDMEQTKEDFIRFTCKCGQKIKLARQHAGKIERCSNCSTRWKVPE
jgi:hypothetical protein